MTEAHEEARKHGNDQRFCPDCGLGHGDFCPPDAAVAFARDYIARMETEQRWVFAKTMADEPHWYVVHPSQKRQLIPKESEWRDFSNFHRVILMYGWSRKFYTSRYVTLTLDGHDYWHVWPVINRKHTEVVDP